MNSLDDLVSGDSHRIWSGSCGIIETRDPKELDLLAAALPEIRRKTEGVALGGALFPNSEHLRFALRKLEYYKAKVGCLCRLYPEYLLFDPNKEAARGNVRLTETVVNKEQWRTDYKCECTVCNSRFSVEEAEYHYTWWAWKLE